MGPWGGSVGSSPWTTAPAGQLCVSSFTPVSQHTSGGGKLGSLVSQPEDVLRKHPCREARGKTAGSVASSSSLSLGPDRGAGDSVPPHPWWSGLRLS